MLTLYLYEYTNVRMKIHTLSYQTLLDILDYDPETGHFTWKISPSLRSVIGTRAGCLMRNGYRCIGIARKKYYEHRLAWFYVHKEWPKGDIDHENHVTDDNRI